MALELAKHNPVYEDVMTYPAKDTNSGTGVEFTVYN
jgi:hypothetical protein